MKECGLDSDAPTVVLQHRTKGLSQLDGVADLDMRAYSYVKGENVVSSSLKRSKKFH